MNSATTGFLAKICQPELAEAAEKLFQEARTRFGYKRKEISLSVASPNATLAAKDFAAEISYALEENEPSQYVITTSLREVTDLEVARGEPMSDVFAGKFTDLSFTLERAAPVEAVIDMIEDLDEASPLSVRYPSDCCDCTISVEGVDAEVRYTGAALELIFPRAGSPGELIDGFAAVRSAFQMNGDLGSLLG